MALLLILGLSGYVVVASGLVEREVDLATERNLAHIERTALGELTREQLDQQLQSERQAAGFWKVMRGGAFVLAGPSQVLGRVFIGAAVIYVGVALSGRKPAYHGLVSILTLAAYTEVLRQALLVPLMIGMGSTDVETSLAVVLRGRSEVSGWLYAGLHAIDPFEMWFYALAAIGVSQAGQLSTRGAAIICTLLWLGAGALQAGTHFVAALPDTMLAG